MLLYGCGKGRILKETNAVAGISRLSIDDAESILVLSDDPNVDAHALSIISQQEQIIDRVVRIEHATTQIEDKADGYLTWWGDFFMGSIESVKWIAIAVAVGVVAFIGARARIWTFIGALLPRGKKRDNE